MIISCTNENSAELTESLLKDKLKNLCNVKKNTLYDPKIKIVGIDNYIKFSKLSTVLMEVPANIYKYVRENNNRVYVAYHNCKVYDSINVGPCSKCGRFEHSKKKCQNEIVCLKCAENHKTNDYYIYVPVKLLSVENEHSVILSFPRNLIQNILHMTLTSALS